MTGDLTRDDISRAYQAIRHHVRRTPVMRLDLPGPVTLKLEQLQCAGSFKARGAFTNLLLRDVPAAGVAAASGGNHGLAVAAYFKGAVRVIGVEPDDAPTLTRARAAGQPVDAPAGSIAALLSGAYRPAPGERVAAIISGASMPPSQLEGR